jgi:hypothetical protein
MPSRCIEYGCIKRPTFNISDEKSAIYCSSHKKDNMVNIEIKYCEHNRVKSRCKECGGNELCKHNRRKSHCKDCGGKSICEHNKIRSRCKECGGKSICEHNRRKEHCRECDGSSFCEHNNYKSRCKECGGSSICEHNKVKSVCRECGGSSFCIHNKQKKRCKECGGSDICEHSKRRDNCRECGGSRICEHNREKSTCKECEGGSICEHNKRRVYCKPCGGGSALCKSSWCETTKNPKYKGYCLSCFVNLFPDRPNTKNYKTKEKATADYVLEQFPEFTWVIDKRIQDGCSRKRPDLLLDLGYHVIVVEIDENQHESYDCSCENKRLMLLSQDVGHRPMVFIRFNPDDYLLGNTKVTSCWANNKLGVCTVKKTKVKEWSERLEALNAQIAYWTTPENKMEKTVEIIQLFYDCN